MKFIELGSYDEKALDYLKGVEPLKYAKNVHVRQMDYLLGFIKKEKPEIFDSFVKNLEDNFAGLIERDYVENKKFDVSTIIDELVNLKLYKNLIKNYLNYFLSLLVLPLNSNWEYDKQDVTNRNSFKSYAFPIYQYLVSLSDTVGKDEAIELYKIFVSEYISFRGKETKEKYETLEEQREDEIRDFKENPYPGWLRIESTVENGKLYHRRDTCLLAESIKELPDEDFRYLVACYKDYQGTRINWNKNFILTMDSSIVRGDPYCSCVIHDTRIDWDLTHPPKEFWDNIWPLKEWQTKGKDEVQSKDDRQFQRDFQQLGSYAPEVLAELQEIKPLEVAELSSLARLDYLLGFIEKNKPEVFHSFLKHLEESYSSMIKIDYYNNKKFEINELLKKFEYLKKYKQLAINSLNYLLRLLELKSDADWLNNVKVPKGNFYRSFLIPRYQNVRILSETIGREEAIRLYKIYRTEHAKIATREDQRNRFDTLDDLRDDDFQEDLSDSNPGWVRIEGIVKNGKFVYRKDSCLYAEAMKDYPDNDFKFLAACYYDFEGTTIQWNKHFILTMDHAIAKGDPYCSCVVHDTRVDWDLTHPSKEYWDSIWPLQEWQKE